MPSTDTTGELKWADVERPLPAGWRELAEERKLVRRNLPAHLGAKVRDIGDILRLVFHHVGSNVGLVAATAAFAAAKMLTLSAPALHKWMRKLGPYLAELVARMVYEDHKQFLPNCWAGYCIIVTDGSSVMCPGAKGTTARVHKALVLSDLRIREVHATGVEIGETFRRFHPDPGELWIGDRGYANPPGIAWVVGRGADVLVRVNRSALPLYDTHGTPIDVMEKLQRLRKPLRPREWKAFVVADDGGRIPGRLCAVRLPPDKAEEARARARREQGADVTEETLQMCAFVVVFTTVPRDRLSTDLILKLYCSRWQIELEFKRNKSLTGLDRLPNFRTDTIESWIYTKLLLDQILHRLCAPAGAFSPGDVAAAALGTIRTEREVIAPAPGDVAAGNHPTKPIAPTHRRPAMARHAASLVPSAAHACPSHRRKRPRLAGPLRRAYQEGETT